MKSKDLVNLPEEELSEKLVQIRKELMKQNSQVATGTTPKSPGHIRTMKRTIARILTIKNKKKENMDGKKA